MNRTHHIRPLRGFMWLVGAAMLGLLAAPVPLRACIEADAAGCSCCCAHEGQALSCCSGETTPAPEPLCCFTVDGGPGLMPAPHREAAPSLHVISRLDDSTRHSTCPRVASAAVPQTCRAADTARRLSLFCSFLN